MIIKNEHLQPVTFSVKKTYITLVIFLVCIDLLSVIIAAFLILIGSWIAVIVPILWTCMFFPLLLFYKKEKEVFLIFSSEGLTFCGTVDSIENKLNSGKVYHFKWEYIKQLGFTRILNNPAYLFVETNEGDVYQLPIHSYNNNIILIDKLRKFTGFHGCEDLGKHSIYVKQHEKNSDKV